MIKLIKEKAFIPDLSQDIHYVSWTPYSGWSVSGYSQMAYVDAVVRKNLLNLKIDATPEFFYRQVDKSNETGTFYPAINITLMPSAGDIYSNEEIYRHIGDVFKAQNELIHAKNMIFDMRSYNYFDPLTKEYDNTEYLYMIDYLVKIGHRLADDDVRVYVIVSGDVKPSLRYRYTNFEYADPEEIEQLKLKTLDD